MKALFIGGTGAISTAISQKLVALGWDLTLLHRGSTQISGAEQIVADIHDEEYVAGKLADRHFDAAADFAAFTPEDTARDIRLLRGKTDQYIFISSASAYQKPPLSPIITESTPLCNPFWQYSRNKIACEDLLVRAYREEGFPITIVRPSHTYCERTLPLQLHGKNGPWSTIRRMQSGKPVLLSGDGSTLWSAMSSRDFAEYFVLLMGNVHAIGESFHITSDESLTWNQMYRSIAGILNVPFNPCYAPAQLIAKDKRYDFYGSLFGDKANTVIFDNSKIKRVTGKCVVCTRFDQGARESLAFLLSHPELQKEDPEFDAFCDRMIHLMQDAGEKAEKETEIQ